MRLIITIGDCNGIGLEALIKAIDKLIKLESIFDLKFDIAGNKQTIKEYCDLMELPVQFEGNGLWTGSIFSEIIDCNTYAKVELGKSSHDAGKLAIEALDTALDKILEKHYDALVTLPISKYSMYNAGWMFTGHTEYLSYRCNVAKPLMILCSNKIRVALATVHVPFKIVPELINSHHIIEMIEALNISLINDFNIENPKIAVLSLNPHAGENATIGTEETDILIPAIHKCLVKGIYTEGPFSSDGFFGFGLYKQFDGILAMYHDQGLIPLKLLSEGAGVNFTAGLPIVRTSPDHGTAYELAGKNIADCTSTFQAIIMAAQIVTNRLRL
ncbi:MAG: 4-hydroxythreonine-4-phosphate dehydrogenase PdxA [Ignavibacteria bacterium GWB2_35_12]|nr:MAG: 4-hydroxythreonine-4-phosphate dehydrogenase PdxA [Ignavibacteria bacterium GWA2_35_8]OGU41973.1 MAG: 4-hydroxythreonine-4-phosphate dehydrogenase PdxA [Ignavibacteria bacterium GWB2_35_12]OGU96060.1 MAG: 4-hydroxythreonine-4-phosphate dehydrogenase PdxA [Ignavibacteria bacterium RIFOXYA2_FULL_35_10]OGV24433.1 MAG: 4-hydroxythreonine-4-phosphate dehydrogenase PdxA [Ignavibacteria bacterium RIFOXYC2_FULL_35_21]